MRNLRHLTVLLVIPFCTSVVGQDGNDDWARAIIYSVDSERTRREIDLCFQSAVEKSDRKADILLCQSDLRLALGLARDVVNVVEEVGLGANAEVAAYRKMNVVLDALMGQTERRRFELLNVLSQDPHSSAAWLRMLIASDLQSFEQVFQLCVKNDPGNAMPYYVKAIRKQQMGAPIQEVIALFQAGHVCPHLLLHPTPYPTSCRVQFSEEPGLAKLGLSGEEVPIWFLTASVEQLEQLWGYEGTVKNLLLSELPFVSEITAPEGINGSLIREYQRLGERLLWAEPDEHLFLCGVMIELRSAKILERYHIAKRQLVQSKQNAIRFHKVRQFFDEMDSFQSDFTERGGGAKQMLKERLNPTEATHELL